MKTTSSTRIKPLTAIQTARILENVEQQIKLHSSVISKFNRLFGIARIRSFNDGSKWWFGKPAHLSRVYPETEVPPAAFDNVADLLKKHGYIVNISQTSFMREMLISKPE